MGSVKSSKKRNTVAHDTLKERSQTVKRASAEKQVLPVDDEVAEEERLDTLESRLIERPDGFYWQDDSSTKLYGPFSTVMEAKLDMQYCEDSDYEEGETLQEAEDEIGIADWVDPETGLPAEGWTPHRGGD